VWLTLHAGISSADAVLMALPRALREQCVTLQRPAQARATSVSLASTEGAHPSTTLILKRLCSKISSENRLAKNNSSQ
jgi:hypothetical protein